MESTISEELIDTSPMESLPTEILQKILGYLPFKDKIRAERVCKRWKNVSTKEVWKGPQKLHIQILDEKPIEISLEPKMRQRSRFFQPERVLSSIDFDELKVIHSLVSRAGQNIKELIFKNYSSFESSELTLSLIATHCHNIESMELNGFIYSDSEAFSRLLRVNKNLNSFECRYEEFVMEALPLKDWKSLYISDTYPEGDFYGADKLLALIENSPSLKNLQVPHLTKNMLVAFSNCKQLKTLNVPQFFGVFDDTTPLLSHLKVLQYSKSWNVICENDRIIDLLRNHCPNLEDLAITQPSVDDYYYDPYSFPLALKNAVFALPKLKTLILDGRSITDENLSHLSELKTLGLINWGDYTENGIFEMIINSEYLEEIDIDVKITVNLLQRLVENTRERSKILKIVIPSRIHEEALNVCKNSKIHLIKELSGSPYFS